MAIGNQVAAPYTWLPFSLKCCVAYTVYTVTALCLHECNLFITTLIMERSVEVVFWFISLTVFTNVYADRNDSFVRRKKFYTIRLLAEKCLIFGKCLARSFLLCYG